MGPTSKKLLDRVRDAIRLPCCRRTVQTLFHPHGAILHQKAKEAPIEASEVGGLDPLVPA